MEAPPQVYPDIVGAATSCVPDPFDTICAVRIRENRLVRPEPAPNEHQITATEREPGPEPEESMGISAVQRANVGRSDFTIGNRCWFHREPTRS
jgi:hypothetical protein